MAMFIHFSADQRQDTPPPLWLSMQQSQTSSCTICADTKPVAEFSRVTSKCAHPTQTCKQVTCSLFLLGLFFFFFFVLFTPKHSVWPVT